MALPDQCEEELSFKPPFSYLAWYSLCLALGATAVSVGRHLMPLLKKGEEAVSSRINDMNNELKGIMAKTGVQNLSQMDSSVIHKRMF